MVHSQSCNKEKGGKAETDENSKLFFDNWLLSIGFTHAPSSALQKCGYWIQHKKM